MSKAKETTLSVLTYVAPVTVIGAVVLLLGFLCVKGISALSVSLIFGDSSPADVLLRGMPVFDGIWPACVGTLYLVLLSCSLSIPVGIMTGIYLAEFAPKAFRRSATFLIELLAGIPSIIMGLFGFALILLARNTVFPQAVTGLWLSALCIAVLVLPYCINSTVIALSSLPEELRLTGPSLGLSPLQSTFYIRIPLALRGIMSGVILSIGRASEDTAVILMTGVVANAGVPRNIFDKYEALPFKVYYLAAQFQSQAELAQGFGTALILLIQTTCLFLLAHYLRRTMERKWF
ncbi:PstA family ABC transporter permease [Halodesulfovibrio marinisediminis]|uniref:Phosphate transport system permease protein n=1 Tax=Halodesulfovibrio marinisediminis DSM 17456 TaxID=1121457 RepID=A0A1N6E7W2_9BACT|nr:ABC transporter permease subunit [Halodesulfovibrio marinisediminis]SIN79102.1 phosphate transport system permease protein [Halodesulfovibrio marinisediminis DSM 17456]